MAARHAFKRRASTDRAALWLETEKMMDADETMGSHQPDTAEKPNANAVVVSPASDTDLAAKTDAERNAVFTNLVREDGDIVGLVAYSIYKQNKVDWLHAFEKSMGRVPGDLELASYIIGESTPRRLTTYRHLAAATLSGNGPESGSDTAWLNNVPVGARSATQKQRGFGGIASSLVSYAVLAAAILIGVWLVARYGLPAAHS